MYTIQSNQKQELINRLNVLIIGKYTCQNTFQAIKFCNEIKLEYKFQDISQLQELVLNQLNNENLDNTPFIFVNNKLIGQTQDFQNYINNLLQNKANLPIQLLDLTKEQELQLHKEMTQITQENIKTYSIEITEKQDKQQQQNQLNTKQSKQVEKRAINQKNDEKNDKQQKESQKFDIKEWYNAVEKSKQIEKEKEPFFRQRLTAKFQDGSHIHYYDSITKYISFKKQIPIIYLNGYPVYKFEWIRLIQEIGEDTCRFIFIDIPGCDNDKITRGPYRGYVQDQAVLLKNLLDYLEIPKIILAAHSFGATLQNMFEKMYPDYVLTSMLLGGITLYPHKVIHGWYQGMLNNFDISHENLPQKFEIMRKEMKDNETNIENIKPYTQEIPFDPIESLSFQKNCLSWIDGLEGCFCMMRESKGILKLIAQGEDDFIVQKHLSLYLLNHFYSGEGNPKFKLNSFQKAKFIENIQKQEILKNNLNLDNFDFEHMQKNFLFYFEKTGHSVHRRRACELKIPILILIELSEILYNNYPNSKL